MSTEPEEYDLVMLGSGFGSKFLAWTFAEQGRRVATISNVNTSVAPVPTSHVCRARTSFIARRSHRTFRKGQGVRYQLTDGFTSKHVCRARP